ncbi:MAG: lyase family protein, partial [Vicinamibacterales bacterium]
MSIRASLHDRLLGHVEAAEAFAPAACLQSMLDVEVALAEAKSDLGLTPTSCLADIRAAADASLYDIDAITREAVQAGNIAIPLIRHLRSRVATRSLEAADHVHTGATSQDVIDTALVLRLRIGVGHVLRELDAVASAAAEHASAHARTPMAGRTWLQHASPTTFGLKAAGWLDAILRDREAVVSALESALVVQCGGASGTLAAFGTAGASVAEGLARRLTLGSPDLPWH